MNSSVLCLFATYLQTLLLKIDIVTGTPGKLIDFISTGKLKLDQVRALLILFNKTETNGLSIIQAAG